MSHTDLLPFDRPFLEHVVKSRSQYDTTCARLAAQVMAAEDEVVRLSGRLGEQHADCEHLAEAASLAAANMELAEELAKAKAELAAVTPERTELGDAHSMMLAALVLGYNEMAKVAKTLGDKVYFRLHRDNMNELLRATGSKWRVEFEPAPEPDGTDT